MNTLFALIFVTFSSAPNSGIFSHESWKHPVNFSSLDECEGALIAYRVQSNDKFEAVCLPITQDNTK